MSDLYAPQMVIRSRMLYFTWVPEDKDAVRALVPAELPLSDNAQCFINQYVVDSSDDTSGFEPYSLTAGHSRPLVDALRQLKRRHDRLRRRARCAGALRW